MTVFVVAWNFRNKGKGASARRGAFLAHLDQHDTISDSLLPSVCWISADTSAEQLLTELRQTMDPRDQLFVHQVARGDYCRYLDNAVWMWIEQHL